MSRFDRIIEDAIQKAISDGEFDNLPGYGKPIDWKDNPHASPEMRLVDDILQKNGVSYPWMEKRKEIEQLIADLKAHLALEKSLLTPDWSEISQEIASINKKIFDYNLSVPVDRLQRRLISIDEFLQE
jgi:DnaJ family protein C protein 28